MRWEDERYVRVYTRDTPDWLALGWEAQALFVLALRKVDRAGMLDLGKVGVRGLAALLGMPVEVVERALPILLADGCAAISGSIVMIPNFIEAQETPQSDRQRKAESRAKARDRARLKSQNVTETKDASQNVTQPESQNVTDPLSQNVTKTEEPSQNVTAPPDCGHENGQKVTRGHAVSHEVTRGHSVLYCAVPYRTDQTEQASSISILPGSSSPNGSLAAAAAGGVETNLPQQAPAALPALEPEAGIAESPPVSAPASGSDAHGLPSPAEISAQTWPLIERLAQHLGELRGLTACPLSWPKRESRDRYEYLLSRIGIGRAAPAAFADWQEATARGEHVTSLGFFLRLFEELAAGPAPPAEPRPLSDCEPWAALLEQALANGHRETVKWLTEYVSPRVEDRTLVLEVLDRYRAAYVTRHLPGIESTALDRFGLTVRLVVLDAGSQFAVGGAP
jgi:hypothetical protein